MKTTRSSQFYAQSKIFCYSNADLRKGEEAENFYLIRKGNVAIELKLDDGSDIVIETLGSGNVLGWSWLISPHQWRFDARAVSDVELIALHGKYLRTKAEEDHNLGYELLKRFSNVVVDRLLSTRMQLIEKCKEVKEEND